VSVQLCLLALFFQAVLNLLRLLLNGIKQLRGCNFFGAQRLDFASNVFGGFL
jgi:hypothetical protein